MITQQKTCILKVLLQWIVAALSGCPLLASKLFHEFIGLHLLSLAAIYLLVEILHELEVSGKEDVCSSPFNQVIFEVLLLMRFFEFLGDDWSPTTSVDIDGYLPSCKNYAKFRNPP
jgi:hypothetical protein